MSVLKQISKSFPLWFQGGTLNANYGSEFVRCLENLPYTTTTHTATNLTGTLVGSSKWTGGVLAPNGKIYCSPGSASSVLIIDTINDSVDISTITGSYGAFAYYGGVLAPNGKIYFFPYIATSQRILVVDTADDSTYFITNISAHFWVGGVLAPNGFIYAISNNGGQNNLKINPVNDALSVFSMGLSGEYQTGSLASNGKIYCFPTSGVNDLIAIIDTATDTVSTVSTGQGSGFSSNILAPNGFIYGVKYGTTTAIKINPATNTVSSFTVPLNYGTRAVLAGDGKIYFMPDSGTNVLVLDPETDTGTLEVFSLSHSTFVLAENGAIYAIPYNATQVTKIQITESVNDNMALSPMQNKL